MIHRTTRPYTPKTNGMVERFNGRIQREVLGITVASHRELETLLQGFNRAYNARRQRVLKGRSPERVVHERLGAAPTRANSVTIRRSIPALCPSSPGDRSRQGRLASRHLILLRHEPAGFGVSRLWQQGHRSRLRARATVSRRLMVAIECGTWRSA